MYFQRPLQRSLTGPLPPRRPKSTARPFAAPSPLLNFGYPGPQGPYSCSVGFDVSVGRAVVEDHLEACLKAGLNVGGINCEARAAPPRPFACPPPAAPVSV